jgi:glutamyl-Q tRNA(Asp) synthetase
LPGIPPIRPDLNQTGFNGPVLTRFAPSPTGYLHLGHVVNAIYVWGVARALGGQVLLRIEDHDRVRSRPEFEHALLEDLDWLGFIADHGRNPLLRQSDAPDAYADALDRLRRSHQVYLCECSRKAIGGERYTGRCRDLGLSESPGRSVRLRLDHGLECGQDLLLGPLAQDPYEQCGDPMLRDRDGHWTYQFAVSVDDLRQHVTLVIRGADLMPSTGRQLRLARMLGRQTLPRFLHHPLILGPTGAKLSKSNRDVGIRQLRQRGLTAPEVIGRAAAAVGLNPSSEPIAAADVPHLFRQRPFAPETDPLDTHPLIPNPRLG